MPKRLTLAGDLGSGKSTVAKIVTAALGMTYYSTGCICRDLAAELGIDVEKMNEYMKTHPEVDEMIDEGLVKLNCDGRDLLIDSRMAFYFVLDTFRVFLSTEEYVSAARIYADKRVTEHFDTVEETLESIRNRRRAESGRYMAMYQVNNRDLQNYHLVLDSSYIGPEDVAAYIIDAYRAYEADRGMRACYLSFERLYFPDEVAEGQEASVTAYGARLEAGERPKLDVRYDGDNRFCVVGDPALAVAYSLSEEKLIPCRLIPGRPSGNFVPVSDSL